MSPLSRQLGRFCLALTLPVLFAFIACREGKSAFDVQVGDCIVPPQTMGSEVVEVERVRTVDCSEPHDGEVVAVFNIEGESYPGDAAVFQRAVEGCPSEASYYLYPSRESWDDLGDREVACIAMSLFSLEVGDCLDYAAAGTTVDQVERVSCSGPHDAAVIGAVEVPDSDFPGDDAIAEYASLYCPERTNNFLGPTRESWELLDDREIICLEE